MAQNIVCKTSEERKQFAVVFDFVTLSEQQNETNTKCEQEITPLLRWTRSGRINKYSSLARGS
jgi:hypothetical protein